MRGIRWVAALVALAGARSEAQPGPVEVSTARFYRGDATTLVDGFYRVPFDALAPLPSGQAAYRVTITVRDSTGLPLTTITGAGTVPRDLLGLRGGSWVEHFAFAARPGRYRIDVALTDSASGRLMRGEAAVSAYPAPPAASDLLLTGSLRAGEAADSAAHAGEVRKGGVFFTPTTRPVLTPGQARLFYYLELYGRGGDVSLTPRVVAADGRQVIGAPSRRVASGGVASAGMDLSGLPPGDYRLILDIAWGDSTITREAAFGMAGFDTEMAVRHGGELPADQPFAGYSERQLDSLQAPLVYLEEAGESGVYHDLSTDGKRNYLHRFWARRDPSPGQSGNAAREDYYARIAEANRRFDEGGPGGVPGWRTDRGRIFLRYGEPDRLVQRPQAGPTPPYEVWQYTRGRSRTFVFLDETRLGNYVLLYTDERREPSRPDWEAVLGREGVEDVLR